MTVGEAIKLLQQEDPAAVLVAVPHFRRHTPLRLQPDEVRFVVKVLGKDSTLNRFAQRPAVVMTFNGEEEP